MLEVYYVYSMKEQVARRYYYKSDLLFRFLTTCTSTVEQNYVLKQFSYVTHRISMHELVQVIKKRSASVEMKQVNKDLYLTSGERHVHLSVHEAYIKVTCSSIFDAEQLLFQPLRLFPTHLFVVHAEKNVYGWISIIKNELSSKSRQAL